MKLETIGDDVNYMDDGSLAALESLDDSAWRILCKASHIAGAGDPGIDNEIALTHETLDNFDASRHGWSERGERKKIEVGGVDGWHPGRVYTGIQIAQGQRRKNLVVLDCGNQRVTMLW